LTDLVDYQKGSVVSQTIVKGKGGNVTLFAFDRGEGLSEHTVEFDALVYVAEGEAEITISDEPYRVRAGELLVMPANEPHAVHAVEPFKMVLTMINS
jgi:quercetin dioxygenase-like cupin family protein